MSRNQNVKSYGRGKHSNHPNTVVHSSIQFDKFFCENSNKPTAAKSAGTIGKWGITSFTSIRSSNFTVGKSESSRFSSLNKKRQQAAVESGIQNKRPVLNNNIKKDGSPVVQRKFFKSRNAADSSQKSYKSTNSSEAGTVKKVGRPPKSDENKKQKHVLFDEKSNNQIVVRTLEKPLKVSIKKIPSPKQIDEEISTVDDFSTFQTLPSPPKERDKPPIVLRIFKGTSQLITESGTKEEIPDENSFESCPTSEQTCSAPPISKPLRRKSSESRSPSPEQPAVKHRRNSEKSHSPETIVKIGTKRRTPDETSAPESEPTITTRSLRRRATSDSTSQQQQQSQQPPNTSPKRVLRSTRQNSAPPPPAGKLVISNLNSDHPKVYAVSEDAAPTSIAANSVSPKRKDSKECRSYGNKHKHKKEASKGDADLKKVEELLADLGAPVEDATSESQSDVKPCEDMDSDRQELLQLLEDDEEDDAAAATNSVPNTESTEERVDLQPPLDETPSHIVKSTESELKIKIKISDIRPSESVVEQVREESMTEPEPEPAPELEPEPVHVPMPDSLDSGICVKNGEESSAADSMSNSCEFDSKDSYGTPDGSDFELKNECEAPCAPIINKKGSIFKHRGSSDGNKKRLALYKHKWADDKDAANAVEDDKNTNITKNKALDSLLDSELEDMPLTKFIRHANTDNFDFDEPAPVTGVKCLKKTKDYYTVVRNVKKAHQIQESGEFQEFNDDVEYILDALQDNNPIGTRCLSAITLASKCTEPAFRMHVRAHGTVTKFFRTLHDATKDQSLGLCTATVMFVLSQDRLNMDLDRDSLELMLNLLESDASHTKALEDCGLTDSQLTKTRDRVRQICADIQAQGHAKHLNLDNITVGHLSMETLLSLTSKRAGEWFKEELRELGGLEHIVKTIVECCKHVDETANAWSATALEKIRKVDRCLRVLENVTMQNEQNNYYLLEYQEGVLIDTLVKMYKVCDYEIPLYPTDSIADKDSTGAVLRECLIANLKVLINITHDYQGITRGSIVIGGTPGVIESSLHVLLQVPQYIPKEEKFDLMLLTLIMLINLVEHCDANRKAILDAKAPSDEESIFESKAKDPAVKALIAMFYNHEELARFEEKKTDAILEGENVEKPQNNAPQKVHEEFIEETISQLVQKAGQNMEHTLIAAYVAMLVGYLIIDNEEYEKFVRNHLPEKNFEFMISVLQKFYSFMTLTASGGTVSNRGMKSVQMVIQKLIDSDARHGFTPSLESVSAITTPTTSSAAMPAPAAALLQQADKALDLNTSSGSASSDDKNFDALRNDSKFCESQNNANMAISAS